MDDEYCKAICKHVLTLIELASVEDRLTPRPLASMQLTQAAVNAAHALATLNAMEKAVRLIRDNSQALTSGAR